MKKIDIKALNSVGERNKVGVVANYVNEIIEVLSQPKECVNSDCENKLKCRCACPDCRPPKSDSQPKECGCSEELKTRCEEHHFGKYGNSRTDSDMAEWEEEFDKLMGQKEKLFKQMGNVIITDTKTLTYGAIKSFIKDLLEKAKSQERERIVKLGERWFKGTKYWNEFLEEIDL